MEALISTLTLAVMASALALGARRIQAMPGLIPVRTGSASIRAGDRCIGEEGWFCEDSSLAETIHHRNVTEYAYNRDVMQAPSWRGFLLGSEIRLDKPVATEPAMTELEDDRDGERAKARHEVYAWIYDTFTDIAGIDQHIGPRQKITRRLPARGLSQRAHREVKKVLLETSPDFDGPDGEGKLTDLDESLEAELYQSYLRTFERLGDRGQAVVLKCSLMSQPCGSRRLLEKAFEKVFPSSQS